MTRVEMRLTDATLVRRDDGLLDTIEVQAGDTVIALVVGPSGAGAASEAGAHLMAAARRQYVPESVAAGRRATTE